MIDYVFEREYFKSGSTYKKFRNTDSAVSGLSNYYFGLYQLISKYCRNNPLPGMRILEIGCGYSGLIARFISGGYSYTGLDISNYIIKELQQKYPDVNFIQQDIQSPIPLDSKFDLVVGMEVLEHIPDTLAALKSLYEVLNDDGVLIASVPNPKSIIPFTDWRKDPTHVSIMSESGWVERFSLAGFKKVTSTTIFTIPYFWHFNKIFSKVFTLPGFGASILLLGRK